MRNGIKVFMTAFAFAVCCLSPVIAQQTPSHKAPADTPESGGILQGDHWGFFVDAGHGWILDEQAGVAQGVNAAFYRKGESWENGVAVMYITVEPQDKRSLKTMIQQDIVKQQKMFPTAQPKLQPAILTGDHIPATIYSFQPNKPGKSAWESVAYVNSHHWIIMLVLTARTQAAYRKSVPNLAALVHSFQWMVVHYERK